MSEEFKPVGGFFQDAPEEKEKNWSFLGAVDDWPTINTIGDWIKFRSKPEAQDSARNTRFDCVSISAAGQVEKRLNQMMEEDPAVRPVLEMLGLLGADGKADVSERYPAKGSGTIPGRGNSQHNVYEFFRKNGIVGEKMWPSNLEMSDEEFYSPLTPEILALGKKFLEYFTFEYKDVGESNDNLREALKRSPLALVVGGAYLGDEQGALLYRNNGTPSYNHQLQGVRQDRDVEIFSEKIPVIHKIEDSYEPFDKDYAGTYPFAFAKIIRLTLKKKVPMLYKKIGQPAICFKHWSEDALIAFADGSIAGGDLFKSLFGVVNYSDLPRQDVEEWPFPIKYNLTTTGQLTNLE